MIIVGFTLVSEVGQATATVSIGMGQRSGHPVGHGGIAVTVGILSQEVVVRDVHAPLQYLVEMEVIGGGYMHLSPKIVK